MNACVWLEALLDRCSSIAFAAVGVVIGATAQPAEVSKADHVSGTYELLLCKRANSTGSFSHPENAFATVVVVLFDAMIARKDVDRISIDPYHDDRPNACYAFKRKVHAQSYAGISERGVSSWLLRGKTIEFDLFRSPDAGYAVEIQRSGGLLTGTGRSSGVGAGAPPRGHTLDTIVGRRVGPPVISACGPGK
jgi:hypothetical protein